MINHDSSCDWKDIVHVFTGGARVDSGEIWLVCRKFKLSPRVIDKRIDIDLFCMDTGGRRLRQSMSSDASSGEVQGGAMSDFWWP